MKQDLIGQKFGRLTVIEKAEDYIQPNGKHIQRWLCRCECGHDIVVRSGNLKNGNTKSCGCYSREIRSSRLKDLTNQKFGKLTVIKRADDKVLPSGQHQIMWECLCECGNVKIARGADLKNKTTTSCGCDVSKKISQKRVKNLVGQKFGRLTVIEHAGYYVDNNGNRRVKWKCKCDCGNECVVIGSALSYGTTQSCGCYKLDRCLQANKKYNTYDLLGEYGVGYTSKGEEFYFDLEDYDKIKDYCWWMTEQGYIITRNNDGQGLFLHRLIMFDKDEIKNSKIHIDHINGHNSRNDNRKINLRKSFAYQNIRNQTYRSNSTSGFIGVATKRNKWCSYITLFGEVINLGSFDNFTDAVKARIEGEKMYFKEFAYNKHQNVLDYINNGGKLEPYNRQMIEDIMNERGDIDDNRD